jgi:hypothetical protein
VKSFAAGKTDTEMRRNAGGWSKSFRLPVDRICTLQPLRRRVGEPQKSLVMEQLESFHGFYGDV